MMHKIRKSTLLDDEDDDMPEFGNSSNRFLKTNKQEPKSKDNFQRELELKVDERNKSKFQSTPQEEELKSSNRFMKRDNEIGNRVTSTRTPTPRSIATDSDMADDSGNESPRISGRQTTAMGDSGWQPALKKSPRVSLFGDNSVESKQLNSINRENVPSKSPRDLRNGDADLSNKWNKPSRDIEDKRRNNAYDDDYDTNIGKSNVNFMKTGKMPDNKQQSFGTETSTSVMRPKPRMTKFTLEEEENEDDSLQDKSSSKLLKTTKPPGFKDMEQHDVSMKPKPRSFKHNFDMDDNNDDTFQDKPSSTRFLKTSNVPNSQWNDKEDSKSKPYLKDSKLNFIPDENDDDSYHDKSASVRPSTMSNIPDSKWKDKDDHKQKPKSWESKLNFNPEENEDDSFDNKSTFLRTTKVSNVPDYVKPKPRNSKLNFHPDEEESFHDKKETNISDDKNKTFDSFSALPNQRNSKYNPDRNYNEEDPYRRSYKSDKDDFFPKPQKRETKSGFDDASMLQTSKLPRDDIEYSLKSDPKIKPRSMKDDQFSLNNTRNKEQEMDLDLKRRSIRFEDEDKNESGWSTQVKSPRKSTQVKTEIRESRSPSPVTSMCEEFERDPVKQKLEEIKQRRQDRKRQEESGHMNTEHRIATDAINAVESGQSQPDLPPTTKRKVVIPLNKKYQNIQSKITTKPNLRSVSMDNLNNILSKIEEPNTDRNYCASQIIRDATYMEWYKGKLKELKDKKKEPVVEEKETKEKRNEDDVKATYDAWLSNKKEYFAALKRKKDEEQKKQVDNKENKDSKDNTFELWKKLKDESKKKDAEKQKNEMKTTERKKLKEAEEKKEELRKKNMEWERRQKQDLKLKKEKEDEVRRIEEEKKNKAEEKQMQAEVSYRTWEDKMEDSQRVLAVYSKRKESLVQNRRAWRPSGNTVTNGK